jgi:hypothetical protein
VTTTKPLCRRVEDHLDEVLDGRSPDLADHVAHCSHCARIAARQKRLEVLFASLPRAPRAQLAAPALPDAPAGRVFVLRMPPVPLASLRWAAAAVAAALLVATSARFALRGAGARTVRVDRVVDVADAPPIVDERLLALTGGFEAVAMRRPTEFR